MPEKRKYVDRAKYLIRAVQRVREEIDKCILVCANCHRELHVGIKQLPKEILEWTSRGNGEPLLG